jgi:hypothetical protein
LVLKGSCAGTFAVPKEWTDKGNPSSFSPSNSSPPILDFRCLFDLKQLAQKITKSRKKRVDNEIE